MSEVSRIDGRGASATTIQHDSQLHRETLTLHLLNSPLGTARSNGVSGGGVEDKKNSYLGNAIGDTTGRWAVVSRGIIEVAA